MHPTENNEPRAAGEAAQPEQERSLFITSPHGDQALIDLLKENEPDEPITQRLYALRSLDLDGEKTEIWLTGEELDSLAHQWLLYRNEQLAKGGQS